MLRPTYKVDEFCNIQALAGGFRNIQNVVRKCKMSDGGGYHYVEIMVRMGVGCYIATHHNIATTIPTAVLPRCHGILNQDRSCVCVVLLMCVVCCHVVGCGEADGGGYHYVEIMVRTGGRPM